MIPQALYICMYTTRYTLNMRHANVGQRTHRIPAITEATLVPYDEKSRGWNLAPFARSGNVTRSGRFRPVSADDTKLHRAPSPPSMVSHRIAPMAPMVPMASDDTSTSLTANERDIERTILVSEIQHLEKKLLNCERYQRRMEKVLASALQTMKNDSKCDN